MTTKQLEQRVFTRFSGHGHYKVTIEYRGKEYHCTTTNMEAIDCIGRENKDQAYTHKQALISLYNECKSKNHIGEFAY